MLPQPKDNETKQDFINRFMADEAMIAEFPDEAQRMAIAESTWENGNRTASKRYILSQTGKLAKDAWIKAFPRGKAYIQKYDTTLTFDDKFFASIAEAFNSDKLSKPFIDIDHDFGKSYGELVAYEIRDDGMYFKANLTEDGKALIAERGYKYVSPAWGVTKDTDGNEYVKLHTISFTNAPALEGALPTLQSQLFAASKNNACEFVLASEIITGVKAMDLTKVTSFFGLNKDADVDSIYAAAFELSKKVQESEAKVLELNTKLTETETKKTEAENKAIELGKKLTEIENEKLGAEATEFLKTNIELGKIHPATQDIWKGRFMANKQAALDEMELIPAKESFQLSGSALAGNVSPEDAAIMLRAELDPKNPEDVAIFTASKNNTRGKN